MAIHFYPDRSHTGYALFVLTDKAYDALEPVFTAFTKKTGIFIDPYGNTKLVDENLVLISQIIKTNYTAKQLTQLPEVNSFLSFLERKLEVVYAGGD